MSICHFAHHTILCRDLLIKASVKNYFEFHSDLRAYYTDAITQMHREGMHFLFPLLRHLWTEWTAFEAAAGEYVGFPGNGDDEANVSRKAKADWAAKSWQAAMPLSNAISELLLNLPAQQIGSQPGESEPDTSPDIDIEQLFAVIDSTATEVAAIVSSKRSASDKAIAICELDRSRFLGWDSSQWSKLLKVSDSAIRQCPFWKTWLPKAREEERERNRRSE